MFVTWRLRVDMIASRARFTWYCWLVAMVTSFGKAGTIKLSRMSNISTTIGHIDHTSLSVMKPILYYAGRFEQQYRVLLSEACINDFVDDMMPPQYRPRQSRFSYARYVRLGQLMAKNPGILVLLDSLDQSHENGQKLIISKVRGGVLFRSRGSFILLQIEDADYYINNQTKTISLHASIFYRISEQLLLKIYDLLHEFNIRMNTSFLV